MSMRRFLLVPQVALSAARAPRDQRRAWDAFWAGVHRTGSDGQVFWDVGDPAETDATLTHLRRHADVRLPLVDLGCGNGRQARALTAVAPRVLGLDRSAAAVERARRETHPDLADERPHDRAHQDAHQDADRGAAEGDGAVTFRVGDVTDPALGDDLHAELGDVNLHVRGVLHVVDPPERPHVVRTVETLLGERGTAYVCETDAATDGLGYLLAQGATPTSMPAPLRRLVAAGLRPPSHFGQREVARYFPADRFEVLAQGPCALLGVPLRPGGPLNRIPGYFAVLRTARPRR